MAIFAIGAFYDEDVSKQFIQESLVGVGWDDGDAPELHQFIRSIRVGDLVYIKSFPPGSPEIFVKAIGVVVDGSIRTTEDTGGLVSCGRNVHWLSTSEFRIPVPSEKNNVRRNTLYEEHHPAVQSAILERSLPAAQQATVARRSR